MSGQLLLLLLTSVLASDDSSLNGAAKQTHVSQVDMFSAYVAEDTKSKKKAAPQLSETQKSMMNHLELADNWTFWYQDDSDQDSNLSSEEWIQTLQKMESFRNYGQFLNQVKTFKTKIPLRIYLFKNSIRPLWEDEANKDGGRLLICLPEERDPARAFESFLKVAVKVMCSDVGARVNGATFAYRPECGATTISVWTPLVWTPQRNKEEFNRFKRLVYEENNNSSSLKILFRPHKTYSVNPKGNSAPTTSSARRPYRQQGSIRPPPGFEGSALSGQWRFPNHLEAEKAVPVIEEDLEAKKSLELAKQKKEAEEEALRQKQAEEEALMRKKQQEEEEERQRILLLEQQKKEKEEARARKLARRQRQKENRKKRKASSRSDSSSEDEEEDMSEEETMEASLPAPEIVAPIEEVEEVAPVAPSASPSAAGYSRYLLPALATLSTVVLAGVPFAFQYLA